MQLDGPSNSTNSMTAQGRCYGSVCKEQYRSISCLGAYKAAGSLSITPMAMPKMCARPAHLGSFSNAFELRDDTRLSPLDALKTYMPTVMFYKCSITFSCLPLHQLLYALHCDLVVHCHCNNSFHAIAAILSQAGCPILKNVLLRRKNTLGNHLVGRDVALT